MPPSLVPRLAEKEFSDQAMTAITVYGRFGGISTLVTRLADQSALRWVVLLSWVVFARWNEPVVMQILS